LHALWTTKQKQRAPKTEAKKLQSHTNQAKLFSLGRRSNSHAHHTPQRSRLSKHGINLFIRKPLLLHARVADNGAHKAGR